MVSFTACSWGLPHIPQRGGGPNYLGGVCFFDGSCSGYDSSSSAARRLKPQLNPMVRWNGMLLAGRDRKLRALRSFWLANRSALAATAAPTAPAAPAVPAASVAPAALAVLDDWRSSRTICGRYRLWALQFRQPRQLRGLRRDCRSRQSTVFRLRIRATVANFVFGSTARTRGQRRTRGPRQRHVLRAYLLTPCAQT